LSIYAYGLETQGLVQNPSFIEWHRYFSLEKNELLLTRIVARLPLLHGVWKMMCVLYGSYLIRFCEKCVRLTLGITTYFPPMRALLASKNGCETTYFIGWHFRNPVGLEKYRDALVAAFTPHQDILKRIENVLVPLRGKQLIGVHLRQQPYRGFKDGSFLVSPTRVRHIVDEYLREKKLDAKDIALVIVSDKNVDPATFEGFATHIQYGNDVTSSFLLSKCSVVIGVNSTFDNLAAWFGNVPHLVTTNEPIDWMYYANATTYFDNKYATFAQ
jgi:hypothetical protein